MNILFTSVGRRVELVQAFKVAADKLGEKVTLIGADIVESAPALHFCDEKLIIPPIKDCTYISTLMEICANKSIDCLIPTIDTDLLLLSENKVYFERIGTKVLISSLDKIKICRNKNFTAAYFISLGLKSPHTVNLVSEYTGGFPAFIKPMDGSSSIDAYKVKNADELKTFAGKIKKYIIQPFIDGTEYTIDIFCDYVGNPVYITPRERMVVRSGEVLKTRIEQNEVMISEVRALLNDFKPCGQITVQLIQEKQTGDNYYIEINPRFGGGAPLSMKAGADSAAGVIRMLRGEMLHYHDGAAEDGAIYTRFDQSIRVND